MSLSGSGYKLQLTLPAAYAGGGSLTATLQTSAPSGIPAPEFKSRALVTKSPKTVGSTVTTLVYLVVQASGTVQFTSVPSFVFTLPSGVSIPSGSPSYVAFYDPTQQAANDGWIGVLGPGTVSGQTDTFAGINSGVTLVGGNTYVYALVYTAQAVATATPAPTPTPVSLPSLPAYCTGFAAPTPNAALGINPQPVHIQDNSGTGATVVLYLTVSDQSGTNYFLQANGQLKAFAAGNSAPPLPLTCFPGSTTGTGLTFEIPPPPLHENSGTNLYIALAPPANPQSTTAPNPLMFTGAANAAYAGPSIDFGSPYYAAVPFDYVETGLPNGTVDTTQVDRVGLPLELSLTNSSGATASGPIGFAANAYQQVLAGLQVPSPMPVPTNYDAQLLVTQSLNNRNVLARILSPEHGYLGFPEDLYFNPTYAPSGYSGTSLGYLGYVLEQYESTPRLYALEGSPASTTTLNYCASYDGTNVLWYNVGTQTTCSSLSSPSWTMPVVTYLEGDGLDGNQCQSTILGMPWGPGSSQFSGLPTADFYLWKAMVVDLARGFALAAPPTTHPYAGWGASTQSFAQTFPNPDPLFSVYARLLHENMINGYAYAMAYDDLGGWDSGLTNNVNDTLSITIQSLPVITAPNASPTPLPAGYPTPCPM